MPTINRISCLFMIFMTFSSFGAFAQTQETVSDQELEKFASALEHVQIINQEAQQEMVKAIQEEGLDVESYTKIQQAQQNPNQEVEATDEEMEKYNSVSGDIEKIQMQSQQKMEEKIKEEGLTIERYQEIVAALQASPELQENLQKYMQG